MNARTAPDLRRTAVPPSTVALPAAAALPAGAVQDSVPAAPCPPGASAGLSPNPLAPTPLRVRPAPVHEGEEDFAPVEKLTPRPSPVVPAGDGRGSQRRSADVIAITRPEVERQVRTVARKIGQAAVEVLAGTRPHQQLARWVDPRSYEALRIRAALCRSQAPAPSAHPGLHRNPVVRSVHCCQVAPGIFELSLVIVEERRVRAAALRLVERSGTWRVAALEVG